MYRTVSITDLPWLMIVLWSIIGLAIGIAANHLFWGGTSGKYVFLPAVGAAIGGFLGLCFYVLVAVT